MILIVDDKKENILSLESLLLLHSITRGGVRDFSSYNTTNYGMVKFSAQLSGKMIFSNHNLASDFSFNSFPLIFCRNVLIYFEKELQVKALKLFDNSLDLHGFLALGTKESLRFFPIEAKFQLLPGREKIWRKTR